MEEIKKTDTPCVFSYQFNGNTCYFYRLKFKTEDSKFDEKIIFDSKKRRFETIDDVLRFALEKKKWYKSKDYKSQKYADTYTETAEEFTLSDVWNRFLEKEAGSREPQTVRRYKSVYENHIAKYNYYVLHPEKGKKGSKLNIEEININSITVSDVQSIIVDIANSSYKRNGRNYKYTYTSIYHIFKVFYLIIDFAAREHILTPDAEKHLAKLSFPEKQIAKSNVDKSSYSEIRTLTDEQIEQIKNLLRGTPLFLPMLISLYSGTRPAETFAIRFSDFNFAEKTLTVNKQIVEESQQFYFKTIKARQKGTKAKRVIRIPDVLINEVQTELERINKVRANNPLYKKVPISVFDKIDTENFISVDDFVAVSENGKLCTIAGTFKKYNKIIKDTICPHEEDIEDFSFYTFRKTHLSRMAASGMPLTMLMQRSGHTKVETLERYYQSSKDATEKTDECLSIAFNV